MKLHAKVPSLAAAVLALPLVISSCSETDLASRILIGHDDGTVGERT